MTHAHAVGVDGAAVQAAAIAAALRGDDPLAAARARAGTEELRAPLERALKLAGPGHEPHDLAHALGSSSAAHESVPAAICSAAQAADFEAAVTAAIRLGGDTDTIGAMCGAIAGARFGAGSIPARWLDALERGERGREHVESLADELARRAQDQAGTGESRP